MARTGVDLIRMQFWWEFLSERVSARGRICGRNERKVSKRGELDGIDEKCAYVINMLTMTAVSIAFYTLFMD